MNIKQLETKLKKNHIPDWHYNLSGTGRNDERLCIEKSNKGWNVYYLERGERTTDLMFDTEDEACNYILNHLVK